MARSADPSRYPLYCTKTMQELDEHPSQKKFFTCYSRQEAFNIRFTWNCFKRAALDAGWCNPYSTTYRGCKNLSQLVCRVNTNPTPGGVYTVTIENINMDDAVARWNREAGCEEDELPQDAPDPPAYMRK